MNTKKEHAKICLLTEMSECMMLPGEEASVEPSI